MHHQFRHWLNFPDWSDIVSEIAGCLLLYNSTCKAPSTLGTHVIRNALRTFVSEKIVLNYLSLHPTQLKRDTETSIKETDF